MSIWMIILLILVVLHFVGGFIYLMYKLSPKKKNEEKGNSEAENKDL